MAAHALMRRIIASGLLLALAGCGLLTPPPPETKLVNKYAPGDPLYASTQVFIDGFNQDPQLQAHFSEAIAGEGMYAVMPRAVQRGARSLDAQTLQAATTGLKRAITSLEPAECAAFFRPNNERLVGMGLRLQKGFEKVPPKHHEALMRYYLAALKAEAANAPEVKVDPQVREQAFRHLSMQYTGAAAERLNAIGASPASASDGDLCWMGNTLLNGMEQLGSREREAVTRTLLGN